MQVAKNTVVTIDYTLKDDDGNVLDSSEGHQPLTYLHGVGEIVPGLENAMEGRSSGDEFQVSVSPAEGYGDRMEGLCAQVSRDHFEEFDDLELGMRFRVPTETGDFQVVTVVEIADETVTVDANHALAGVTLNFDIAVREVRKATPQELEHGHSHSEENDDTEVEFDD